MRRHRRILAWVQSDIIYIYALYERGLPERVYRYVGRTNDTKNRLQWHRHQSDSPWIREVHEHGGAIDLEVIQELKNPTRTEVSIAERNWVMALGDLATNTAMRRSDHYAKCQKTFSPITVSYHGGCRKPKQ